MKHKGSVSQVNIARDRMVAVLFREAKRLATWPTNTMRLCEIVAELPVREFFLPEENALTYIRQRHYYGIITPFTNKYRQRLYDALYDRVMELWATDRYRGASIPVVVAAALQTEAPCLGLSPRCIYLLIPHRKYPKKKK